MSAAVTPVLDKDWRVKMARGLDAEMRNEPRNVRYHWLRVGKACKAISEHELYTYLGFKSYTAWLCSLKSISRSRANEAVKLLEAFADVTESALLEISKENLLILADQPKAVRCSTEMLTRARVLSSEELLKEFGLHPDSARMNITIPSAATDAVNFALEVAGTFGDPTLHPLHKIALRYLQSQCDMPGLEELSMEQAFARISQ